MATKTCRDCGESHERDVGFYAKYYSSPVDGRRLLKGYSQPCKWCRNRNKAAREKIQRHADPSPFRQRSQAYKRRWPERNAARCAINRLVRLGKIPSARTLTCADCGAPATDYDHHQGYDAENRLNVIPTCRKCHRARGVERGEYATQVTQISRFERDWQAGVNWLIKYAKVIEIVLTWTP